MVAFGEQACGGVSKEHGGSKHGGERRMLNLKIIDTTIYRKKRSRLLLRIEREKS